MSHATGKTTWTIALALRAGQAWMLTHGRLPNTNECRTEPTLPSMLVLVRLFGDLAGYWSALEELATARPMRKVYTCLRCGKPRRELRIDRRICQGCTHRHGGLWEAQDATWLNGDIPPQTWRGYGEWRFMDDDDGV